MGSILTAVNDDTRFPRRIGLLSGGGDAPGLNAVIRAIVKSAANTSCECVGRRTASTAFSITAVAEHSDPAT